MDPPVPLKKKRCPKGTRINKQGECVPVQVPIQKMIEEPTENPIENMIEPPSRAVTKKKRCPKGTRINKQGECVGKGTDKGTEVAVVLPVSATKMNVTKKIRPTQAKESLLTIREPTEEPIEGIGALYPTLDDPNFNIKIAQRKEFFDTRYDGTIADLKTQSDRACKSEFELLPHQLFIKNFLSMQTPYSSILLNWGLGASKTCGAIGIAEEMRAYMKQIGMNKRILILAYPNVLDNFRLQLFDETKLKLENGLWNISSCVGNSILNELNPTHLKDLNKSRLVANVNAIIKTYYDFKGYLKFSNEVANALAQHKEGDPRYIRKIQSMFNDHLIVIDEVHNIRQTRDNANLTTANYLYRIAKYAKNLRFVLLSATPMYNSYKEIIWLTNLMNVNDGRSEITADQVFTSTGEFVKPTDRDELVGEELLRRKLTGYVSYVRGENPYTFPYRIYRSNVSEESDTKKPSDKSEKPVPKYPPLYVNPLGELQERVYHRVMEQIRGSFVAAISEAGSSVSSVSSDDDDVIMQGLETLDNIGYEKLRAPIQALNIVYGDIPEKNNEESGTEKPDVQNIEALIGRPGLLSIMEVSKEGRFAYRTGATHLFDPAHLVKYSHKMATILELIANSTGIVLIYSEFIDAGIVPMALALESAGFTRYAGGRHKNLPLLSSHTIDKKHGTYAMITGNKLYSPHNKEELEALTSPDNKHGERIRVVLISKAGAEGLDFKNIRQIHIMEPWFNMSRIEQIIGRGVRNSSHCQLPFEERNVEIYMHATTVPGSVDMHLYELAFKKAKQIGQVSRLIKESSVDCILNRGQHNFTVEQLATIDSNKVIHIHSSHGDMEYSVGDRPYTAICDYLDTCPSKCKPDVDSESELKGDVRYTYSTDYVHTNRIRIVERIRQLFQKQVYYPMDDLVKAIQTQRFYPIEQIYAALTYLIENRNEFLVDSMGRLGNLINRGEIYAFQPVEISDEGSSIFDRTFPVEYKIPKIRMQLRNKFEMEHKEHKEHKEREKEGPGEAASASYQSIVDEIRRNIVSILEGREETEGAENPIKPAKKSVKETKRLQTLMIGNRMIPQQQWTDYMHVGGIVPAMEELFDMDFATIRRYMIHHAVDALPMKSKLALTAKHRGARDEVEDEIEEEIQKYLGRRIHRIKGVLGAGEAGVEYIILPNETLTISIFKRVDNVWTEAEYSDIQVVKQHVIDPIHNSFDPLSQHVALLVGFFVVETPKEVSSPLIFKVKDYTKITSSGNAVGENIKKAGKKRAIQILKIALHLLGLDKRSEVGKTDFDTPQYGQGGICMMVELLLRHSREHLTQTKKLYLTPEEAVILKIFSKIKPN
jgi:Helicase conserved C-terminal domain